MINSILDKFGYLDKNNDQYLYLYIAIPKTAVGTITSNILNNKGSNTILHPYTSRKEIVNFICNKSENNRMNIENIIQENTELLKRSWIAEYINSLGSEQRKKIICIIDHQVYYGMHELFEKPARYITFLREPLSMFISLYNYMLTVRVTLERLRQSRIMDEHNNIRDLDTWLEQADLFQFTMTCFLSQMYCAEDLLPNEYIRSISDQPNAKKLLDAMWIVGLTENEEDVLFVYNCMGVNHYMPDMHVLSKNASYRRPTNITRSREILRSRYPEEWEIYEKAVELNREFKIRYKNFSKAVAYTKLRRNISKIIRSVIHR